MNKLTMAKTILKASVTSSTVINTPDGPLLEIVLTARLAEVPPKERLPLVEVLHCDPLANVNLLFPVCPTTGKTPAA